MSAIYKRGNAEIESNLTPMIDVTFLLIVFFVLVSQIVEVEHVEMRLPQPRAAMSERLAEENRAVINVLPASRAEGGAAGGAIGGYRLGSREFPPTAEGVASLSERLAELYASNPTMTVNLRADRATDYRWIDPVMEAVAHAAVRSGRPEARARLNLVVSREDRR